MCIRDSLEAARSCSKLLAVARGAAVHLLRCRLQPAQPFITPWLNLDGAPTPSWARLRREPRLKQLRING
eukprot:5496460-Alexandrium_andersonii.AAC.1